MAVRTFLRKGLRPGSKAGETGTAEAAWHSGRCGDCEPRRSAAGNRPASAMAAVGTLADAGLLDLELSFLGPDVHLSQTGGSGGACSGGRRWHKTWQRSN